MSRGWLLVFSGCLPAASTTGPAPTPSTPGSSTPAPFDPWTGDPWEPAVCTTLRPTDDNGFRVVDLDLETGVETTLATYGRGTIGPVTETNALARQGDEVLVCGHEGIVRLDLATGGVEYGPFGCTGVTELDGGYLVARGTFEAYATWADVMAGVPTATFTGSASRLGRADGYLFTAPWAGSELYLLDPVTAGPLGTVALEDFDTWITGISAVGDRWFVADDGRGPGAKSREVRIAEFTPDGAAVASHWIGPSEFVAGLSCRANVGP